MTKRQKKKAKVGKPANEIKKAESSKVYHSSGKTILNINIDPILLAQWPNFKMKIPPVFLHKPADFEQHVRKILNMGIKFYQPHLGHNYTRITCLSYDDHKYLIQYLNNKKLPYHTFGNPSKRKMKVVIRGIPKETNLDIIKEEFKSVGIPIIRVHKMHTKEERKDNTMLVLAVVPHNEEGKQILKLTQVLGHNVKLEPPEFKPKQCYRCQKWGHTQRYCYGQVKCVKCAGDHLYKKCERDPDKEPPKCANCNAEHTANYRECIFAPGSELYKQMQAIKKKKGTFKPLQVVTLKNIQGLYKNVDYDNMSSISI